MKKVSWKLKIQHVKCIYRINVREKENEREREREREHEESGRFNTAWYTLFTIIVIEYQL